jgi:hypothetical protein
VITSGGQPPGPYDQQFRSRAIDVLPLIVSCLAQYDSAVGRFQRRYRLVKSVHNQIRATRVALQTLHVALKELASVDLNASDVSSLGKLVLDSAMRLELRLSQVGPFDDPDIAAARRAAWEIRNLLIHGMTRYMQRSGPSVRPATLSRRTRCATRMAVRLLPPADRERYREEFASELADLPRIDQAPYAVRLVFRAWSQRRSLRGKASVRAGTVIGMAAGSGGLAWMAAVSWPAAVLGGTLIAAVLMTINSNERTRRLASLIRAARGRPGPATKD